MRVSLARIHYLQWVRDPIILTVGGEGLGQERGGGGEGVGVWEGGVDGFGGGGGAESRQLTKEGNMGKMWFHLAKVKWTPPGSPYKKLLKSCVCLSGCVGSTCMFLLCFLIIRYVTFKALTGKRREGDRVNMLHFRETVSDRLIMK